MEGSNFGMLLIWGAIALTIGALVVFRGRLKRMKQRRQQHERKVASMIAASRDNKKSDESSDVK